MNKIRIIDLLNKIANGEEAPKKINYKGVLREYNEEDKDYISVNNEHACYLFFSVLKAGTGEEFLEKLTDEVEIIEEDKKIEKIKSNGIEFYSDYINVWIKKEETVAYCEYLMNKVNELIDTINELKRGN